MSLEHVSRVKARLDALAPPSHASCGVFCSTCGGYARSLPPLLTPDDHEAIKAMLESSTLRELKELGIWFELLPIVQQPGLRRWARSSLEQLTDIDLQAADELIFEARHWARNPQVLAYDDLRKIALRYCRHALMPENRSLLETIILTLKNEDIPEELVEHAIEVATSDRQIARVLYNRLRERDKRVRTYCTM